MGPRGGHWFPRRHRAVASGRGSGRGWGGRRPRAPPRTPPAPAGRASPQRRLQTANPFFSSLAKETDPPDTSAPLDQLSLQLLRFQNSSNPCTPIFEASLSISLHTPHSLGPSDQPPDPGSRVGRGGRCWVFIPAAFTRLLGAGRMRISYGLERVLFRLTVWLSLSSLGIFRPQRVL